MGAELVLAKLTDLAPQVRPYCPGADTPTVEQALRDAAIEFFRATGLWEQDMDPVDVKADKPAYNLAVPPDAIPERISRCELKVADDATPYPLTPMSIHELRSYYGGEGGQSYTAKHRTAGRGHWETIEGTPRHYTHLIHNLAVRLVPIPTQDFDAGLLLRLLCVPKREATQIPEWLMERHWEALACGARSRLMKMPDKAWTDREQAQLEYSIFHDRMVTGMHDRMTSHTGSSQTMMPNAPLNGF